ncbi:hypothetical protein V6N11_073640 [Hibiscus sabdariffa]|uniref:Secreted protein n=1 Tax=Hibiscus sabdariffa TaxID=183260 RepID=A0ABR2NUJ7_9ROSI
MEGVVLLFAPFSLIWDLGFLTCASSSMIFPPLLFHTVLPRVPPNTSVGHQGPPFSPGSKRIRHHNPSEVVKGTPENN